MSSADLKSNSKVQNAQTPNRIIQKIIHKRNAHHGFVSRHALSMYNVTACPTRGLSLVFVLCILMSYRYTKSTGRSGPVEQYFVLAERHTKFLRNAGNWIRGELRFVFFVHIGIVFFVLAELGNFGTW